MADPNPYDAMISDLSRPPVASQASGGGAPNPYDDLLKQTTSQPLEAGQQQPPQKALSDVVSFGANGEPIFADASDNTAMQDAQSRIGAQVFKGATFGMSPYLSAGARWLGGTPFQQGLQESRDYNAQTEKDQPGVSLMQGVGSLLPTMLGAGVAAPAVKAAETALPRVGGYLARTILGSGLGAASTAGQDIGSGQTDTLGPDTAAGATLGGVINATAPVVGRALQAPVNMARGGYTALSNMFTGAGRDAVAGTVLREASGGQPLSFATSPLPGLDLRSSQATGNVGLGGLERALAPPEVQLGRTPDQNQTLLRSLVGSDAGIEPAVQVNQAGARGTQAITATDKALSNVERGLWNAPALQGVKLDAPSIAKGVSADVASFPASWRDAVTGPQGKLGAFLNELHDLGPNATIQDVNSVRSRLLGVARDAASGPSPDSVTAAAARRMAGSITDGIGSDPAITGAPATTYQATGKTGLPIGYPTPVAAIPANPAAAGAYQAARDFTRQYHTTTGFNEFDRILSPNSSGNIQGNPEKQFGQFFDPAGGTSAGLQRLQGLADLARKAGATSQADELEAAANQYLRASIVKQSRAGNGLDLASLPQTNLGTMSSTVNKIMPAVTGTPMTAGGAGDIQAAGNAAELMNRANQRGDMNSTTFEKLRSNNLVSAIMGGAGSSGLGALAGGYEGYEHMPASLGGAVTGVPAGALMGALAANRMGPALGKIIANTPVVSGAVTAPTGDILKRVMAGLATPAELQRLIATKLPKGPAVMAPGLVSGGVSAGGQAAIPMVTGQGGR